MSAAQTVFEICDLREMILAFKTEEAVTNRWQEHKKKMCETLDTLYLVGDWSRVRDGREPTQDDFRLYDVECNGEWGASSPLYHYDPDCDCGLDEYCSDMNYYAGYDVC